jgi:hypothetical protein
LALENLEKYLILAFFQFQFRFLSRKKWLEKCFWGISSSSQSGDYLQEDLAKFDQKLI